MEAVTKQAKSSSNISDIVCRFAKVCRLRSIGVFSSENPNHQHYHDNDHKALSTEGSSDATEETECDAVKIHPQPLEEKPIKSHEDVAADAVLKLFDTISSLKLAYIELQEAHIPYDPERIQAADEHVVSKLKSLCETKRAYKEKQSAKPKSDFSLSGPHLLAEIQDYEILLENLRSQVIEKDSEILQLGQLFQELDRENAELDKKLKQKSLEQENVRLCKDLKPNSLHDTFKAASRSIHDFAKPLISLMKASCWDLDLAANSIEDSIIFSKRSHKKFAFEAYISRRMFHGFSLLPRNPDEVTRFKDPFESLIENPSSDFAKFCRSKYLLVMHPEMEASFFGNLDQRAFVSSGKHPRTPFYQAFVKMAHWIWILQAVAASLEPTVEIFAVPKGSEFSELYMENVVEDDDPSVLDGDQTRLRVGFMVVPGFRHGQNVIRSRVYLSRIDSTTRGDY